MSSEYDKVKISKLVFKGEGSGSKKRKHHKKDKEKKQKKLKPAVDEDMIKHGGFWKCTNIEEITGNVAIEFGTKTYIKALDNGKFIIGAPHNDGDPPDPEEILTAIKINDTKIALKSGYGKFLSLEKDQTITGRSEAVGAMEQFEPIFQDTKLAILCANQCFMSIDPEDDELVAIKRKVGDAEIAIIRSSASRETNTEDDGPIEEKADLSQVEVNYVKKFQKFQDKKMKVSTEDKSELEKAKKLNKLHEVLLDRRSKMKADRYCK